METNTQATEKGAQIVVSGNAEEGFDLSLIRTLIEREIQVEHKGRKLPIFVTIAGPEHPSRKAVAFEATRRMREIVFSGGKAETDAETEEAFELAALAGSVISWRGVKVDGVPVECNRANVSRVLGEPRFAWFREFIKAEFDRKEAFTVASVIA